MNAAQKIAKQVAQEPWEILKQAGRQVAGAEAPVAVNEGGMEKPAAAPAGDEQLLTQRDKIRSQRLLQALEVELKERVEIRKKKEVPRPTETQVPEPLPEVSTKPGRKLPRLFGGGRKAQMQRQQTQTERPLPLSG